MRRIVWAWLAINSLAIAFAGAATRPHYGGNLTVELSAVWTTLDPASSALSIPITETLVKMNAHGVIEPALCVAWQHDPDFKRWRFSLRPRVTFHDGEPLTGPTAAPSLLAALKKKYADISIEAGGQAVVVQSHEPMPDLLADLAARATAVFRTSESNPLIGTGPFRVTAWEPGRRLVVAAFDDYWNARPYLDSIAIEFGSSRGPADVFDIPAGPARRILPQGVARWSSAPRTLVAITAANVHPALFEALGQVIDRGPIANVLAQHRADPAFGLLPQWLTGYAFLFQSPAGPAHARQSVSQLRLGAVSLSYPANDPFLRSVAERVALNARDAGITIQPTTSPAANLRLIEWPLESEHAVPELKRIADSLGLVNGPAPPDSAKPEALYQFERTLLDAHRMIPLVYLRQTYAIAPRVHVEGSQPDSFALHLENAWLEP